MVVVNQLNISLSPCTLDNECDSIRPSLRIIIPLMNLEVKAMLDKVGKSFTNKVGNWVPFPNPSRRLELPTRGWTINKN